MQNNISNGFACKNTGCLGVISRKQKPFEYAIGWYAGSFTIGALVCPKCKRLHWPDRGLPLRDIEYQRVFKDGKRSVVSEPLDAVEMLYLISEITDNADVELPREVLSTAQAMIKKLIRGGHAKECKTHIDRNADCSCGRTMALAWLKSITTELVLA